MPVETPKHIFVYPMRLSCMITGSDSLIIGPELEPDRKIREALCLVRVDTHCIYVFQNDGKKAVPIFEAIRDLPEYFV